MRVVVDLDICTSNAVCSGIAPEVFEVGDDGSLRILQDHPAEDFRDRVEEAARACPTQAISITD